ncbi:Vacuolar protein sorting-associated protein 37A [Dinochytrium kinnereticum]|nr:Vacuolar protein sorting-associated protein 37A [Dinochytrium kinnereticum]
MTGNVLQARELQRNTLYEVPIHLSGGPIFLHITLPNTFPDLPPTITVKPNVVHPWIGPNSHITGHEKLKKWNQHMSLAKIVQEIVQEFVARNPVKVNPLVGAMALNNSAGSVGLANLAEGGGAPQGQARFGQQKTGEGPAYSANPLVRQQSPHPEPAPAGPQIDFMGLENKSLQELEELMSDEVAFEDFFQNLPQFKEQQRTRGDFVAGNEALAKQNLSMEARVAQLRTELEEEHRSFRTQREQFDANYRAFQDLSMRYAPDYMISRIRTGVTESEELSESVASSFLGGKMAVEDFVRNYRETRKVYHQRAARLERVMRDPQLLSTR